MSSDNITAINVFVQIDGKQYLAPLSPEKVHLFIGMLPAFQSGEPNAATMCPLPTTVAQKLMETRRELGRHLTRGRHEQ